MAKSVFLNDSDVCVVGGGPAGLAAAIALRLEGFTVNVFDCAVPPIDKACGEGLMPDSLAALEAFGVKVPQGVGFPFRGVCFVDGKSRVAADFPNGNAIGLRRTVLHTLLVERAAMLGVGLHWGVKEPHSSGVVIAADGQNSQIETRCRVGQNQARGAALWLPAPLQNIAVVTVHGVALGQALPALHHAYRGVRNRSSASLRRSEVAAQRRIGGVSRSARALVFRRACFKRNGRGDSIQDTTKCI